MGNSGTFPHGKAAGTMDTSLYQQAICVMGRGKSSWDNTSTTNSGTFPQGKAAGAMGLPGCLVHS